MSENLSGIRVLIIDDSNTIRRSAEVYLVNDGEKQPTGIVVKAVEGPFEAFGCMVEFNPDVIFLDVSMPKLDGFDACKVIRGNADMGAVPIVMLTSKDTTFDQARAQMAGASDYVTKPFTRDTILAAVRKHRPKTAA